MPSLYPHRCVDTVLGEHVLHTMCKRIVQQQVGACRGLQQVGTRDAGHAAQIAEQLARGEAALQSMQDECADKGREAIGVWLAACLS